MITRILVVDDEPLILDAYRSILERAAVAASEARDLEAELFGDAAEARPLGPVFELVTCTQGQDAVRAVEDAAAEGRPFALAFMDVRMPPGIDGVEASRRIREIDPDVNIVIVTGYADLHPREIAQRVPTLDKLFYLNKPFDPIELQQFAHALAARWRAERSLRIAQRDLERRLSELEAAQADLAEARERAEQASRIKSQCLKVPQPKKPSSIPIRASTKRPPNPTPFVILGLDPWIHVDPAAPLPEVCPGGTAWMPVSSTGMTVK